MKTLILLFSLLPSCALLAADAKTISAHAEDEAGNVEKLAHEVATK